MPSQIETPTQLDSTWIRKQFPALSQTVDGHPAVFFDGPGGTQVPQRVIDAIAEYLTHSNANTCGAYATSRRTNAVIDDARSAMADFLACSPDEVVFGPNMTTLTYAVSRAIGREFQPGDEIVLTLLDHDANFSPWKALEERGVVIRTVDIDERDCTLNMADLAAKITERTKLVAVGYASNATGTINPIKRIVELAHEGGALTYVDAVHYAPHGLTDVGALDCDFLACSTYKFFGPHMGVLYGKREHLQQLRPYKLRANTDAIPNCWEWGTLNHECIAGISACVEYLADLGRKVSGSGSRRDSLAAAYAAIRQHERHLAEKMLEGLQRIPGVKIFGITERGHLDNRCPTFAVRIPGHSPLALATSLGERGFFTWDGNYYAINLTDRLNVEKDGGFLRIGLVHYNTAEEVGRFLEALGEVAG